ncbi:MAG: amidohydrolase family protein [Gemmatimonadales bacterium]
MTALALAALLFQTAAPPPVAITDVAVVVPELDTILPGRTVLIENGRIRSIAPAAPAPTGARRIDGRGRFLIPGLWDMHVHVRHPSAPEVLFPQFVANGVTGVRDMASACDHEPREGEACAAELQQWARRIDAGELVGPRLLALASFPLNPPWNRAVTETEVRGVVRTMKERGLDYIKVYYRLTPEAFGWVMDEAKAVGIAVGGHIPIRMSAAEASNAGLRSLEHARDFMFDCFPGSAEFRRTTRTQNPSPDVMRAMVEEHDPALCDRLFATMTKNQTWYVPTLVTRRMDAFADDSAFRDDPRQRFIPAAAWRAWNQDADRMVALDSTPAGREMVRRFYRMSAALVVKARAAGVPVVVGTDAGDSFVFPGSSVQDELGELVKAGLTPAEALSAATSISARFLGREADYGSVAPGKVADLVLLRADPLADVANVGAIEGVIFGGRYYDRSELDAMLATVARAVAER